MLYIFELSIIILYTDYMIHEVSHANIHRYGGNKLKYGYLPVDSRTKVKQVTLSFMLGVPLLIASLMLWGYFDISSRLPSRLVDLITDD